MAGLRGASFLFSLRGPPTGPPAKVAEGQPLHALGVPWAYAFAKLPRTRTRTGISLKRLEFPHLMNRTAALSIRARGAPSRSAEGGPDVGRGGGSMRLINQHPGRAEKIVLGALPFVLLITAYAIGSNIRLAENPNDKLLPSFGQMAESFYTMAFVADVRSGDYLLWGDTGASLGRLLTGIAISAMIAIGLGVPAGFIPRARAMLAPFVAAVSLIPPITVLPILFIIFGLGEVSKIMLIVIGTAPIMVRALAQSVSEIPQEQIVKAVTLGASTWQMVVRVVLPQIMPKLITAIRLGLVPAWIFLISAEAIASTDGLGYRIFLVRRYLAMDVILPYVAWITLIAFALDRVLFLYSKRRYGWAHLEGGAL